MRLNTTPQRSIATPVDHPRSGHDRGSGLGRVAAGMYLQAEASSRSSKADGDNDDLPLQSEKRPMAEIYPTSHCDSKYQRKGAIDHEEFQPT
jgi:hypothetical protein